MTMKARAVFIFLPGVFLLLGIHIAPVECMACFINYEK
jgi:hypothetical protein